MIRVTRFDQSQIILNADLIETIEETPDTVITMITGRKTLVRESAEEIAARVIAYRHRVAASVPRLNGQEILSEEKRA